MSNRQRRSARRARARAVERQVLSAARPDVGGPLRPCIADGCLVSVRAVRIGPLVIALCAAHKAELDRMWTPEPAARTHRDLDGAPGRAPASTQQPAHGGRGEVAA
jgi:hypothetical protein